MNPAIGDERVVILAPSGRDAVLAQHALAQAGLQSAICANAAEAAAELRIGAGTAIIAVEALGASDIALLSGVLRGQPEWSDFGMILLTRPGMNKVGRDRLARQLSALPSTTILERPLSAGTLISAVETMLRSRRRQYELRSHLIERERLKGDLEAEYARQHRIAETLQRSLLSPPDGKVHPDVDTATIYRAASDEADVGGDFYDQFLLDDRRIAVVVGDVSGKGLHAAARTMEVKYPLRAFLREGGSPSDTLSRLNDFLIRSRHLEKADDCGFICLFACVLDTVSGRLVFANAGMEPPVLHRMTGEVEEISGTAAPLGVEFESESSDAFVDFGPGDTLLICTDGIIEARRDGLFFGHEGLVDALRQNGGADLRQVVERIVDEAVRFAGGQLTDDACVLGARLTKCESQ